MGFLFLSMASVLWELSVFIAATNAAGICPKHIFISLTVSGINPIETFWKVARGLIIFGVLLSMIGIVLYILEQPLLPSLGGCKL